MPNLMFVNISSKYEVLLSHLFPLIRRFVNPMNEDIDSCMGTLCDVTKWATTSHHHKSLPRGAIPRNCEKVEIHEIKILSLCGVYLPLSPNMESASMWKLVTL